MVALHGCSVSALQGEHYSVQYWSNLTGVPFTRQFALSSPPPRGTMHRIQAPILGSSQAHWVVVVEADAASVTATLAIVLTVGITASVLLSALTLLVLLER